MLPGTIPPAHEPLARITVRIQMQLRPAEVAGEPAGAIVVLPGRQRPELPAVVPRGGQMRCGADGAVGGVEDVDAFRDAADLGGADFILGAFVGVEGGGELPCCDASVVCVGGGCGGG